MEHGASSGVGSDATVKTMLGGGAILKQGATVRGTANRSGAAVAARTMQLRWIRRRRRMAAGKPYRKMLVAVDGSRSAAVAVAKPCAWRALVVACG